MIAHALRTKAQVICACLNEKVSVFRYFRYFFLSASAQKVKLTVNFLAIPLVKFCYIWQTASKYFTLVGAHFLRKSSRPDFAAVKDINLQK